MDAGGSMERCLWETSWRCEHQLRNEVCRVSLAITLARGALASGDQSTLSEMLAEAEDATKGCMEALRSQSATLRSLASHVVAGRQNQAAN